MFVEIVVLLDLINMASIIITLKIMPADPEVNLSRVEQKAIEEIKNFAGKTEIKRELEPVAFGLNALKITFVMDENIGSTDELEEKISKIEGVSSVKVVDVRRAIG